MKKIIFILSAILIGWLIAHVTYSAEREFDITFSNESDHVIIAYLYQINHTMPNFALPINRAAGEIDPRDSWTIQIEKGCEFFVVWRGPMSSMLQTKSTKVVVLSEDTVFRYQPIVIEDLDE